MAVYLSSSDETRDDEQSNSEATDGYLTNSDITDDEVTDIEILPDIIEYIFNLASLGQFSSAAIEWCEKTGAKFLNDVVSYGDEKESFEDLCFTLKLDEEQIGKLQTAINDFYYGSD